MSKLVPSIIQEPMLKLGNQPSLLMVDAADSSQLNANAHVTTMSSTLWLALISIVVVGVAIRMLGLNTVGFNTDEAVYAGQAGGIISNADLKPYFPVFRAHPLLFQFVLAITFVFTGVNDYVGRMVSIAIGALTILAVFATGKSLYSAKVGLLAALFMAVMPYHVIVTRQVILDGPMTLCGTLALYSLAQFGKLQSSRWLYATGLFLGLTFLSKETGIILVGSVFLFLALSRTITIRLVDLVLATVVMVAVMAIFPLTIILAGSASTGQSYLIWQLLRKANHEATFYLVNVLPVIGPWLVLSVGVGMILRWKQRSWRETLLFAWMVVPLVFFQIWAQKGFQYLLPIVSPIVILAAVGIINYELRRKISIGKYNVSLRWFSTVAIGIIVVTLAVLSLQRVQATQELGDLAGAGGTPGGRETGLWFKHNTLAGSEAMAIGPSMANLVQFYGYRKTYMLSISVNPLQRNPAYTPIINPNSDLLDGKIQYIVWDAYSAQNSKIFSDRLLAYAKKFNGRAVHTEKVNGEDVVIVYEVHP